MKQKIKLMSDGMDAFCRKVEKKKLIYAKLLKLAFGEKGKNIIYQLKDRKLFLETMTSFGAMLDDKKAKHDLMSIYDVAIHKDSGTVIIANKGATLFSLSPKSNTPSLTRHIGLCLYIPGLGIEFINVGLVGEVYKGKVVLRSESACTPSFLFGSQRCNCAHQWDTTRELAAYFNPTNPPKMKNGRDFEQWVQKQVSYSNGKHIFKNKGKQGFILMHIDTQNGMGSGFSENEFSFDLFSRSSMRHRGEYSSEQIHQTTMSGGFEAIGIRPDPRQESENIGYKVTSIVLDYLGVSKQLMYLTNNLLKLKSLKENKYQINRMQLIGEVNLAGAQEAKERGIEFNHLDIDEKIVSFKKEFSRLKNEIIKLK